jgi:hypothetical protein
VPQNPTSATGSVATPIESRGLARSRGALILVAALAVACAAIVGGVTAGPSYLALYCLATIPGLPVGFMLFGARHPAGWIAGALLGYAATALALWAPIAANAAGPLAFLAAWATLSAITWFVRRSRRTPAIALHSWRDADSVGLAIVLALTLALATPPLARVGEADSQGDRVYRAYFTADFVWHTALAAELAKFSTPPRNPYLASQPIHYYWTYFLVPAVVSEVVPGSLDVQQSLKVNALITGLLFMSAVFLAAWAAVGRAVPVTIAVALALVAASAEGAYELYRLWSAGQPLAALRDLNIDAITAWHFQGHRIDGLPRCLWYVPQHSTAYALGLVALAGAASAGSSGSVAAIVLSGLALAGSTMVNPFVGGVFALAWGAACALDALGKPQFWSRIALHGLAAIPVAVALAWCWAAHMADGAGGALNFGFYGASRHAPVLSLILSLGPVLVPALAGWFVRSPVPFWRILPATVLIVLSLLLMYLVRLHVDAAWVPFRAGQMLLVAVPAIIARGIVALWNAPRWRIASTAAIVAMFAIGLPTTAIDAFNAQDVEDMDAGPGFHWTLILTSDELEALAWIRRSTPRSALVQMEPTIRDRDSNPGGWGERWSLIPSFAERRMAAGIPISLMRIPEYAERSALVRTIYQTPNAHEAWTIARRLRIAYLYVDALDRRTYEAAAKFDTSPEFFTPVFRRGQVGVYEVRGQSAVSKSGERPDGGEPVGKANLLAFVAAAGIVADRDLDNAVSAGEKSRRDLVIELESGRFEREPRQVGSLE